MVRKGNSLGSSSACQILTHKLQVWLRLTCCCSVTQSCPALRDPMDCSAPGFPVLYCLRGIAQTHAHWVSDAISSSVAPLLFSLSIFPSTRVFSNESAASIRWPKYWSFSFSISPSSDYWGSVSGNQTHHKFVFLTSGHTENKLTVTLSSYCCYLWSRMAEAWWLSERWFLSKTCIIILKLSSSKS